MFKKPMLMTAALATAMMSPVLFAETITLQPNAQWNAFDVDNSVSNSGGLEWIDLNNDPLKFTFTLTHSAFLDVVDAGIAGDVFNVYANGVLKGQTSAAVNSYPNGLGTHFDAAWANPNYSHGSFWFQAGTYTVTGLLTTSALDNSGQAINATVGAVRLDIPAVPEPESVWLMMTGGLLTFIKLRRAKG